MSTRAALDVHQLSHRYPGAERLALDAVSLRVSAGERLGLLGPNGAGKSTLMRLCCGFLPLDPDPRMRVELWGLDVRRRSRDARACVGYLPEHVPLYHELRAREHLHFRARIKGVARAGRRAEVERVAERTGITHVLDTPIGQLSRGYRQRVGVADALLGSPPVVILDEPTVGLDPNQVREVRAMLRSLGGTHTVIFSSHILAEVEMLCDRVVILSEGRVVADESLAQATAGRRLIAGWRASPSEVRAVVQRAFEALGGASAEFDDELRIESEQGSVSRVRVPIPAGCDHAAALAAVGEATRDAGLALVELRAGTTRLEERFAAVTGGDESAQDDAPSDDAPSDDASSDDASSEGSA